MKRAVEVSNYLPVKIDNTYTTPHFLTFGENPLLPMFAVAHIRRYHDEGNSHLTNTDVHSTSAILLGRAENSPSTLFYHLSTGKIIISDDFYLDESIPAGPTFGLPFQGGFHFHSYRQLGEDLKSPTYIPHQNAFVEYDSKFQQAKLITLPSKGSFIYTVQILHDKSIHQYPEDQIHSKQSDVSITQSNNQSIYFPSWIIHDAPATFFLPTSDRPQHGRLL